MNGESNFSSKKKIVIGSIVAVITILAIIAVYLFGPDPMPVDWSIVESIPSNVTLLEAGAENNPSDTNVALVRYKEDGTIDDSDWKVLQFTDMHLTQFHDENEVTLTYFIETIKREKPDFVVLTGDIITRPRGRARAIQLAEIFEKMNVYWCYCLGNHEGDSAPFTLSREENIRIWSKYPHCLVENDVKKTADGEEVCGLGNTVVNLLGAGYKVDQCMIFIDSGNKVTEQDLKLMKEQGYTIVSDEDEYETRLAAGEKVAWERGYTFLQKSQMKWYEEQVKKVAMTGDQWNGVKTMLFIHIPLAEMGNVKLIKKTDVLPTGWRYGDPYYIGTELYGYTIIKDGWNLINGTASYEKCYCADYNNGMYDLMKSMRKGVNALFCGHDHVSNSILYESALAGDDPVYLCYGVGSGLESYNLYSLGLSDTDDYALRGYAIIMVKGDSSFDYYNVRYNNVNNRMARVLDGVACD